MTEGEQDRGTTATGTTVIASSDVHDADIARARGEDDDRSGRRRNGTHRSPSLAAGRNRPTPTTPARLLLPPMSRCKRVRPARRTG